MRAMAIGLVSSLVMTGLGQEPARKKEQPAPRGVLVALPGYSIGEGDEVQLFCVTTRGQLLDVAVADDYGVFSDLQKAIYADDTEGLRKLIEEDKTVHLLPSGTRVRVIKLPNFDIARKPEYRDVEIRILDGPRAGKPGFAIYEYVRKCQMVYPRAKRKPRR